MLLGGSSGEKGPDGSVHVVVSFVGVPTFPRSDGLSDPHGTLGAQDRDPPPGPPKKGPVTGEGKRSRHTERTGSQRHAVLR